MSRSGLEGERKQVTVLLADIRSSLELFANRDPEEARSFLDPVLELMMQAVHQYEGIVNQVMGDGIMALFGAPLAHEQHALRACCAALRIQEDVNRLGDEFLRNHGIPVQIRIGVNSGEVVVRSIGSDLDMDYTAVGQTTHLAGRLEQMAKPGTILCGPTTLRLAEGFLRCRSVGPVPIRGLAKPVEVAELTGIEVNRVRFHAAVARGLSPLVGRLEERDAMVRAIERAVAGNGQIVLLVGEPGVGKSRLCWELTRSPLVQDWLRLEGAGSSSASNVPYGPLALLFRTHCGVDDRDDARQVREKVATRLAGTGGSGQWVLPALLGLIGLATDDAGWDALDPPRRRYFTTQAIVTWLLRESEGKPVLLLLEDLQWVDQGTQAVLDALSERIATTRILILTNCRPEYKPGWESREWVTVRRLGTLPRASAEELLQWLLGDDPSLRGLTTLLVERTGGNPLFLEEMVRSLVEIGALIGRPSSYELASAVDRIEVPPSVRAILAARVDRLHPGDKRIVQAAAVVGDEIPFGLLAAAVDLIEEKDLYTGLTRLREAGFLYEARLYPELTYAFAHPLVQEVVYGGLIQERRRVLHQRVLTAMESLYSRRAAEHVERLAQHAVGAMVWPSAARYLREAGTKAVARSAYQEAVTYYEQALMAVENLPPTPKSRGLAIDLRFELRNALYPLGQVARAREQLLSVRPIAEALGDEHRLGWLLAYVARDTSLLGDPTCALDLGGRALAIAERRGEHRLRALATAYLGCAHHARGEYRAAVKLLNESIVALDAEARHEFLGLPAPAGVFFRAWLVWSLARRGDFIEGRRRGLEALDIAVNIEHPLSLAVAHYSIGVLALFQLDFPRAVSALEASFDLCARWNLRAWFPNIASHLGYTYARLGRPDEGIELLQKAIYRISSPYDVSGEISMLAEALLLAGRPDQARENGERALAMARAHQERGNEARARWALGEVIAHESADRVCVALEHYREALTLAIELEMRPLVAICNASLARLYTATGQEAAAIEAHAAAEALRDTLDMRLT
jgi:class 3 adenylate cyclase/tetratricopeptide (TPR) repeat protein